MPINFPLEGEHDLFWHRNGKEDLWFHFLALQVRKEGLLEKGPFQKSPFSSRDSTEILESLENPQIVENKGEIRKILSEAPLHLSRGELRDLSPYIKCRWAFGLPLLLLSILGS